jgi:hypothetical protein
MSYEEMSSEVAMTVSFEKPCRILSQDAQGSALVLPERRQLLLEKYERASSAEAVLSARKP